MQSPLGTAALVFILVLGVGVAIMFGADLFPEHLAAYQKGKFAGQTVGVFAAIAAVGAYFLARSRRNR